MRASLPCSSLQHKRLLLMSFEVEGEEAIKL